MLTHTLGMFSVSYDPISVIGERALIYNSASQTLGSATVTVTYDSVSIDEMGAYSGGNPTRLTIPSDMNGRKCRILGGIFGVRGGSLYTRKNNADYPGAGGINTTDASTPNYGRAVISAPIIVSTSDYFEIQSVTGHYSAATDANLSWMAMEILPLGNGASVYKTATQSITLNTDTAITMDSEFYDDGGWHDPSTNPSRLTVPDTTTGLVRLSGGVQMASGLSEGNLFIKKNGSRIYGLPYHQQGTHQDFCIMSAVLPVSAGDYFELCININTSLTHPISNHTWFEVEEIPTGMKHALVRKSVSQSISNGVFTPLTWAVEEIDVGDWFSSGANTRFTVPSGVTKVRLSGNAERATEGNSFNTVFYKNGSPLTGVGYSSTYNSGGEINNNFSAILDVTAGDYFDYMAHATQGANVQANTNTWFAIEEIV